MELESARLARNCYCTLEEVKALAAIVDDDSDDLLMLLMDEISRAIDRWCGRHFYISTETRYYDASGTQSLIIGDCLALTEIVADSERDGTYDGETWTEGTHFWMQPANGWPKWELRTIPWGAYGMPKEACARYWKLTGVWGYGDGASAEPWRATGQAATTTDSADTLTLSDATGIGRGATLRIGDEQMFVIDRHGNELEVARGVNGTTAAEHTDAAVNVARYPEGIVRAARWLTKEAWEEAGREGGLSYEMASDYQWRLQTEAEITRRWGRILGHYRRIEL
jgi:hypothetical protein